MARFVIGIDEVEWAASKRRASSHRIQIGIDEVGRGALAGPVVLAAMRARGPVRWRHPKLGPIRDSKRLTPRQRDVWFSYLAEHPALEWRVAWLRPQTIDRINIAAATNRGARRLAERMLADGRRGFVWLDGGLALPGHIPHTSVIKGDERLPIVAAASIMAKVWRDRLMVRLARRFLDYGFERHKGYGTRFHYECLRRVGPSRMHRRSFLA